MLGLTHQEYAILCEIIDPKTTRVAEDGESVWLRRLLYTGRVTLERCGCGEHAYVVPTALGLEAKRIHEAIAATSAAA